MDNQRQADEIQRAILAGFFAGEGCICIEHSSKSTRCPILKLYVGNSEEHWAERFRQRYGGYVNVQVVKTKNYPYYKWSIGCYGAEVVLKDLLPFLIGEKVEQAKIALELIAAKRKYSEGKPRFRFSSEQLLNLKGIAERFKQCRRAAAETKRSKLSPATNDSPNL